MYETKKRILEGKIAGITKNLTRCSKRKGEDICEDLEALSDIQQELNGLKEKAPVRLVADDVTMEILGKLMEQNHERIGIFSTEDTVIRPSLILF